MIFVLFYFAGVDMSVSRSMMKMMKDAERASKRQHFDPASITHKPRWPWLDIAVGEWFTASSDQISHAGIMGGAQKWSNITGRVYSVRSFDGGWQVTRTA